MQSGPSSDAPGSHARISRAALNAGRRKLFLPLGPFVFIVKTHIRVHYIELSSILVLLQGIRLYRHILDQLRNRVPILCVVPGFKKMYLSTQSKRSVTCRWRSFIRRAVHSKPVTLPFRLNELSDHGRNLVRNVRHILRDVIRPNDRKGTSRPPSQDIAVV